MVHVADFGLAKQAGIEQETLLTQTGTFAGTMHYMAPEQTEGFDITPATDVYALGVIWHELLTGKRPGAGKFKLQKLRSDCPGPWVNLIEDCLEQDPADRPSLHVIREILQDKLISTLLKDPSPDPPPQPTIEPVLKVNKEPDYTEQAIIKKLATARNSKKIFLIAASIITGIILTVLMINAGRDDNVKVAEQGDIKSLSKKFDDELVNEMSERINRGSGEAIGKNIPVWQANLGSETSYPVIGLVNTPGEGAVYAGAGGEVHAFNRFNGQKLWSYRADSDLWSSAPVVGNNGHIYICSHDNVVHCIDPIKGELI